MKATAQALEDDIRRTLAFYHPDGTAFELCGIGTDRFPKAVDGGFFDNHEKAVEAACKLTRDHHAVYITINPVDAALLSRANNRIKSGLARTQDKEVPRLQRLLIDADPVRPSGTSSTDAGHDAASELCGRIKADLSATGWPEPLAGDSGNGGHLIYRLPDLPNTTGNIELLKACLQALAQRYNTDTHHVDETTFNPSRLSKLYGTWARKGDSTPDRPHRHARILSVPAHTEPVALELLKALAENAKSDRASDPQPKNAPGTGSGKFDLAAYLGKYGVNVKQVKPHGDSTLHVLECCLFDESHTDGEAAIGQAEDGKLFYQCFHNSCKGKTWHDARQKISGDEKISEPSGSEKETKETQAQRLIQLAADATLFHSPDDGRFAVIISNEHREVWPIHGRGFRDWLNHQFYKDQGKPPGTQALQDAIRLLEAKARFEGEENPVFVRVGENGGNIYLDLCNASWEAVEITRDGWRVISDPAVKFRRAKSMLALPRPEHGGSLEELKPFLNLPDDKDCSFSLICGFLVQCLNPSGPYPIVNLEGEQGTAKSFGARILRSLVDPSKAMLRKPPRDEHDLLIAATNSWVLAFDNLSGVPDWLSDAFCRLSTGGGDSTRKLYTDDEEEIFEAIRPQILTGIDRISSRHDLIDRSIVITLPFIPENKRRKEKELWRDFETARPRILGALCNAVSMALANIENVNPDVLPRMADFAAWVIAAEPALPWKPGKFIEAYSRNQADAISLTLDADSVACAVRQFMDDRQIWEGRAGELLEKLKEHVSEDTRKLKEWPKAPNSLSHELRLAANFLRNTGIEITFPIPGSWRRDITIRKGVQKIVETVETVETRIEQQSAVNDPSNDPSNDIVDAQKIVETSLTDKPALDKAFNDVNDLNDEKHTHSKNDEHEAAREVIEL